MPQLQVVDLSPKPRTEKTNLENTLSAFANRQRENQIEKQETDALSSIYNEYKNHGKTLDDAIMSIQTRPGISPTSRVNAANQLLELKKTNIELQKKAKTEAGNKAKIEDIEKRRNLEPGSLSAYEDDPKMAEQVTRTDKKNQASQPIDEDQLKRINHVLNQPEFENKSPAEKNLALIRAGVSKENSKAVIEPIIEQAKIGGERNKILTQEQAKQDVSFADEQTNKSKELFGREQVLDQASALNEQGVTGKPWDQAMQKIGLLQFTNEGYRVFTSLAKDAVKNQNIKSVIGSQISQLEFAFFRDATINPNFSKEANRQIIKKEGLAVRYEKLYADITKNLIEQNGGEIPERLQAKVNDEFSKQAEKISKELKETAIDFQAIQNVPPGKVLMYDKKRRPLHVPANEVEKYSSPPFGATLS